MNTEDTSPPLPPATGSAVRYETVESDDLSELLDERRRMLLALRMILDLGEKCSRAHRIADAALNPPPNAKLSHGQHDNQRS